MWIKCILHALQQLAIRLAFHQEAPNQLRGNLLDEVGEEGVGQALGERGGYGSGLSIGLRLVAI
jgi:hypothetical protein